MAGIPVGTLPQFLLICSCFIAVSEAFTCFSVSDCRGDVVRGVGRPGDCCARSGLSFLTPDEGCTNCFREEAFVGEGSTLYLGFFSNFNPGQFFTRADIRLLVGVSENRDVQFTVETRGQVTTYTATRTSPAEVDLDTNLRIDDIRTRGNGIFVRSLQGEALSVVALASEFTSADTFKVLPSVYLPDVGYEYYAVSVPRMNVFEDYEYDEPEPLDPLGDSTFVIVATEDETIITLSLTQTVDISNAPDLVTQIGGNTIQAGNLETVVLNRLQTLLISSENDLSSSRVWSDKPISLISGHECGNLPDNLLFCDQLVEQIPPTSTWGTRFITAPIANRTQYDIFKVIASRNGTTVRRVCNVGGQSSPITLARGQITDLRIFSNQSCYFESDNPVLLVQFSVSSEVDGTTNADPFMVVIPPVEQYRTNYTINTFQSTATSGTNFINILVPAPVSNTNILINGTLIGATFTAIQCVNTEGICAYAAQMSVPPGTHFITHENPQVAFGIITYWLSFRVGHGHFGGAMQRPIALPQVTLQSAMMELYESNVSANFTLTRSGDTRVRAVVSVRTRQLTSENAAIAGVDYIPRNITVVFSPGETTQEFRVLLGPDDIFPAPNKTFEVYLASSPGIYLSPFTYTMVTILNDDPDLPVMNISFTRTVINVREGVGVVEFVLRKTPGAVGPVSVLLRTHEGTARAEEDYTHLEERVEFGIEDLEKRVMVLIADNEILENVERFTATIVPIRGPFPVAVQNDNVTVIIRDNDFAVIGFTPVLYTVEEGRRSLSVNVTHQIGALGRTVTLSVFTVDGSATAGSDFTQVSQEVVFSGNAGTSQLVSIAITDDNVVEMLESFRVELQFGPEEVETDNILLIPNEATVTITDNDIADIGLDIARRTVMEGEGSLQVTVRVLGDRQLDSPVTVGLSTVSLNATAGDDFQSVVNLPLVLSTGEQQSQQASIDIVDDRIRDDREMFRVLISLLSSNGRARIPTANASTDILIMDNDPPNTVQCFVEAESCGGVGFQAQSVRDCCTILSGTSFRMTAGTELCQTCLLIGFEQDLYTLSERAAPYSLSVTTVRGFLPQDLVLGVSAIPDTASASDYQLASSRIVLTRNSPNATVQVTIPQETLRTDAPLETFRLVLSDALGIAPSNLFFRDTNIIIQDIDVTVEFDPASYTVLESGRFVNITIVKRGQTTQTVNVDFSTADGTATAVQDYVSTSRRVTFPPTVTSQTVMVSIVDDNVVESMEQFTALLSVSAGQSGVGLGVDTATVNIIDGDVVTIGFDAAAYTFTETDSTVSRPVSVSVQSGSLARDVVVTVQTMDGTATAPSDYTSVFMDLTFNSGTTNQTVMIPIVGDNVVESTESFTMSLTSADSAVTLNPSTTTVTIQDDDGDDSSALIQSCHDATGCGGNVVTGVSTARECCLGSGLSFQNADGTCRQCIVHGFVQTTDLVLNEGTTQQVIRMILDVKGNTISEPASTRVLNFGFSFTCIDSSNGGGPQAVDRSDYTDTGCGSNIQLRMFPSAQRRSEVGINAVADDKIEGTEVLMLRLILTSATQTAVNNAENVFFQDTVNIRVIDLTAVVIGFSDDSYTGDEGEPGDVSRPNTPCTVTVEIIGRSLEIPLQIRLTPGEQNATRRDFNDTVIVTEVSAAQTLLVHAIQIFDDEINEGREIFNVSLEVVSNISNAVQYRIKTTLCRIRQSDPIEIGFTLRRIFHTEQFQIFDTLVNKSRVSEQTFTAQVELSTLNSPFGQSATQGEDFQITGVAVFMLRIDQSQPTRQLAYQLIEDNTPENQEVFQLSITPAIDSPTFTCTEANGCFQQLEVVIVDDDVVVVGFVETLVEVNETNGQATLDVSITRPLPMLGVREFQLMFQLLVGSTDGSAGSHSAIDTLRNPIAGVEDFPRIVDGTYYTFQEMPLDIPEFRVLNQMFNATRRSQAFTFPIFVDDVPEGVEELQLTLSLQPDDQLPEGAVNVTPAVATVRIRDSSSVVVGFERRTYTVNEGDGQVELCVNITVPRRQDIGTVNFSLTVETRDGSAVSPDDYMSVSMILRTFTSQQPRQCFNISIMNDVNVEVTEEFTARLTLIPASVTTITANRIIVDPPEATVQITNNVLNVVIGFSEPDYTGDEGEPGDVSRPNTPCIVTVEIIERSLEIPLQIRLTPGEGNATRLDFNDTVIVTEVPAAQTLLVHAIQIFDDEINEGREVFNVSLEVVSNISIMVTYRIQTTLCRIRPSDPIEIGFTLRRIFHTEQFRTFDTLINKSRASEQIFFAQIEISTLNSPFGQSATQDEDFLTGPPGQSTVIQGLFPSQPNRIFSYQLIEDNTPENQEVFQLSITPEIGSPAFTCTEANGCFPQLEIVIVDDDVVVVGFVETLVEVNETDGQATLNVSISSPAPDPRLRFEIMFSLNVNSMDGSAGSHSAIDTLRNPIPGVEDFPWIVDGTYYTFQEMPFDILEFRVLNQMFNATQQSQTFTFPIFVDDVPEGVEELNLTLSLRPDDQLLPGAVNVTPAVATVRIRDSSSMVVGFERRIYTVGEADGQVELCVNITVPRRQDIGTVSFNLNVGTQDGTAVASGDYTSVSMTLGPFTSQQPRQCFNVSITNDTIVESNETFTARLTLASVTTITANRVIIDPPEITVLITDNDLLPPPTTTTMYTNEGDEFFVGFMENPQLLPTASDDSFFISTNQSERVVSVNVTIRGGRTRVLQAAAAVTNTLSIPSSETRTPPQGIHILAPDSTELTVFGSNEEFISLDGFLALPCPRLPVEQYNYYAISVPPTTAGFSLIASDSAILIVSCNNDTRVTFTPTQTITDPQNSDSTISAGTNTTVTLAEAQPLYIQGRSDLTGTHIVSNQPISFFSGHECAYRPPTQGSQCDHVVEQIPPTVTWGKIFLTAPSADRTTGDIFKIVTSQENTAINITCVNRAAPLDIPLMPNYTVALEAAGNSWKFTASASDYCSIEADKPIFVAQIGIGDANTGVDTYMTLVPAVSQYRNNIRFSVVGNPGLQHWINMFVIPAYFEPANITVDGVQGSLEDWVAIHCNNGGVCGYGRQIMLGGSRLKLVRHDNPEASLGVIVYGSAAQSEAYGYPGGLKLSVNDSTATNMIDVVVVGFVDTLVEVNETDGQATLNVSISSPQLMPGIPGIQIMFSLLVNSLDGSAASHSAIDTLQNPRNPIPGVEDFPQIVDGIYYTFQEMPFDILEFSILHQIFNETRRSQTFTFPIFVDDVPEGVEELQLTLSLQPDDQLPPGSVNVTPAVATVRIHDSSSVVVGFERRLYTVGEEDGQVELCVNITVPRRQDIGTVNFSLTVETQDGSAVSSDDYASFSMTLGTFTSGRPRQCFNIPIINDAIIEQTEKFTTRLTLIPASVTTITANRIIVDSPEATVQITDNDLMIVVGYNRTNVNAFEADRQPELIVSISEPAQVDLFENSFYLLVNTQDGTATAPGDYGNLTNFRLGPFNNSVRQLSFNVSIVNDSITEDAEIFSASLTLDSAERAVFVGKVTVFPDVATATIVDNDVIVVGYIQTAVTVLESDEVAQLQLTVAITTAQLDTSFSLHVNTSDGTATAPDDYSNLINFCVGPFNNSVRQLSFNVSILDDNITEDAEMFNVSLTLDPADQARLGNRTRLTVSPGVATVTIQDNEAITVGYVETAVNVSESDGVAQLTVAISVPPEANSIETLLLLLVNTLDETATVTAPGDYGNLTNYRLGPFGDTVRQLSFNVSIVNDNILEDVEMFNVSLTLDPADQARLGNRVTVSPDVATITIQDNDELQVGYSVTNMTVPESDEVATLTLLVTDPIETSFSLIVNTLDGTATAPGDYGNLNNFRLGPFNDDVRLLSFTVSIVNDNIPEDVEMFNVSLTLAPADQARLGNHVTVSPDVATVTIQDDDGIIVGYNVTAVNVSESNGVARMTVAISVPLGAAPIETFFSLMVNTLNGTATAPGDYGNLANFHLGPFRYSVRQLSFNLSIVNDNIPEGAETFNVSLTLDSADQVRLGNRMTVSPDVATVTIQDDDEIIVGYIMTDMNVSESDGEVTLTVAITVPTDPIETSFSLIVNTIDGTATAPGDYGNLTNFRLDPFNNDLRELSFNVTIVNDNIPEDVEMLNVSLTLDPADQDRLGNRVTVSPDVATITIQDDDTITVGYVETAVNVSESDGVAQLTVGISMPPENISIETSFSLLVNTATGVAFYMRRNITADNRAAAFCDYGGLTNISLGPFNNDTRELTFNVSIVNDNSPELAEIFYTRLSPNHTDQARLDNRVIVSPDEGTVTIQDNDDITVGYHQTDVTVSESDRVACLTVEILMPGEEVPIDSEVMFSLLVSTSDGMEKATSNVDYNALTNFPLGSFSDDMREFSFNVSIVNDSIPEGDEMFRVSLTLDSAGQDRLSSRVRVSPNVATVTILDDEIVVGYVQPSVNVSESDGVAQLTVNTSMPSGGVPHEMSIFLIVDTSDETAIAFSDYGNLTNFHLGPFNNSVRQLSFNVSIVSDNITEDDEMFSATFTLDPATKARLGNRVVMSPDVINVTIQDDDEITVGYIQVTVNVSECDGMAQLTVAISMPPGTVPMETSFYLLVNTIHESENLPARGDYGNLTNYRLGPFNNDVRQLSFNVSIVNDNIPEDVEMFNVSLTLDPADQDRLGSRVTVSPDVATVTIQDDDVPTTQLSTLVSYSMTPSPQQTAVGLTQVDVGVILGSTVAAMVVLILCIGIAIIAIVYLRRKQHTKNLILTRNIEMNEMNPYIVQGSQVTHDPYTDVPKLLISSNSIRLLNVVGQGEFAVVYKAHLVKSMQRMPEIVAVKTLKGFFDQRSATDMMKESEKMQDFEHPHVLNITGVCLDAGSAPYIVMPFMANGSLLAYIKKEKMSLVIPNDTADEEMVTVALKRLADMCIQIGKGMEYLASKKIVHRDLAARNCMIDAHFVIKVADFGLSENLYSKTYFRQEKDQAVKLPVKWLALEALIEWVFSEKSDVWSYGVTCWELFTGGRVPYPGVDPVSLPKLLESGHRLDKPNNAACSEEIYLFMLKCWHGDPEERPTFSELVSLMSQTLESLAGYMDVSTFGKLEVHGEDPHDEGTCDEGTNEEDPHDEATHGKNTHGETLIVRLRSKK